MVRKAPPVRKRRPVSKRAEARGDTVTWETVRELAGALPDAEESTSYGTPAFKVRGRLFARLHQSGESVVVRIDRDERAMRMRADPEAFYITDHYMAYPWMLVRFSAVRKDDLADLLEDSWRHQAPKRLAGEYDRGRGPRP
jgi:hypothetical protein